MSSDNRQKFSCHSHRAKKIHFDLMPHLVFGLPLEFSEDHGSGIVDKGTQSCQLKLIEKKKKKINYIEHTKKIKLIQCQCQKLLIR